VRLHYDDIAKVGINLGGYYFVQNKTGHRIIWNYMYGGYPQLNEAIMTARPDLFKGDSKGAFD
jgi:hypothetical protein